MDGLTLFAVSSDGTLACFAFDASELEGIAPPNAQKEYLKKFDFIPPPLPQGFVHVPAAQPVPVRARANGTDQGYTPPSTPPGGRSYSQGQDGFASSRGPSIGPSNGGGELVTTLVARRAPKDKNKRRMQPTFIGSLGGESNGGMGSVPSAAGGSTSMNSAYGFSGSGQNIPMAGNTTSVGFERDIRLPAPPMQNFASSSSVHGYTGANGFQDMDLDGSDFSLGHGQMDMEVPISAFDSKSLNRRGKGESVPISYTEDGRGSIPKARTLGGDRTRDGGTREVREIRSAAPASSGPSHFTGIPSTTDIDAPALAAPALKTFLETRVEDTGDTLEARNSEDGKGTYGQDPLVRDRILNCVLFQTRRKSLSILRKKRLSSGLTIFLLQRLLSALRTDLQPLL